MISIFGCIHKTIDILSNLDNNNNNYNIDDNDIIRELISRILVSIKIKLI